MSRAAMPALRNIIRAANICPIMLHATYLGARQADLRAGARRRAGGCGRGAGADRALYGHEKTMRTRKLKGAAKLAYRREHGVPVAERFFAWCREQCGRADLLPKSPLAKALKYALDREAGLSVYLSDADVPMDTNHLERGLRPIPMGRRNWLFAWTKLGRRARRGGPGPAPDLLAAGCGPVHLSGRCPSTRRRASREPRDGTHAAGVEDDVRVRSAALRPRPSARSAVRLVGRNQSPTPPPRRPAALAAARQLRPCLAAYLQEHCNQRDGGLTSRQAPKTTINVLRQQQEKRFIDRASRQRLNHEPVVVVNSGGRVIQTITHPASTSSEVETNNLSGLTYPFRRQRQEGTQVEFLHLLLARLVEHDHTNVICREGLSDFNQGEIVCPLKPNSITRRGFKTYTPLDSLVLCPSYRVKAEVVISQLNLPGSKGLKTKRPQKCLDGRLELHCLSPGPMPTFPRCGARAFLPLTPHTALQAPATRLQNHLSPLEAPPTDSRDTLA